MTFNDFARTVAIAFLVLLSALSQSALSQTIPLEEHIWTFQQTSSYRKLGYPQEFHARILSITSTGTMAFEALGERPYKPWTSFSQSMLIEQDQHLAQLLHRIQTKQSELAGMLKEQDPDRRKAAILGLGELGSFAFGARQVPLLTDRLRNDEHLGVSTAAAEALGLIGRPASPATPVLIEIATDENKQWVLRESCLTALARIGPKAIDAIPQLVQLKTQAVTASDVKMHEKVTATLAQIRASLK
jgi:HEAT repeat protein